jgi:hypothetical protein
MRSVVSFIVIALALGASANSALARPAGENPQSQHVATPAATHLASAFPVSVPSRPGEVTDTAAAAKSARAQERYYASYADPTPLNAPSASPTGGVDWAAIGISIGATALLMGVVIALAKRSRRRGTHTRVIA